MFKKTLLLCTISLTFSSNYSTVATIKSKICTLNQDDTKNLKEQLNERINTCNELIKKINEFINSSRGWATWQEYFDGLDSLTDCLIQFKSFSNNIGDTLHFIDKEAIAEAIQQRETLKKEINILDEKDTDYRDKVRYIRNLSTSKFYISLKEFYNQILLLL